MHAIRAGATRERFVIGGFVYEVAQVGADFENFEYARLAKHARVAAVWAPHALADVERCALSRELVQTEEVDLIVGERRLLAAIGADLAD